MAADIPDSGGSEEPKGDDEVTGIKDGYVINNLETGSKHLGSFDDKVDDDGRLNRFFREIGRDGGNN